MSWSDPLHRPTVRCHESVVRNGSGGPTISARLMPGLALVLAMVLAGCGGGATDPVDPAAAPSPAPVVRGVAGELFRLETVGGTPLPARFEPADIPGVVDDALILAAVIGFQANGWLDGTEDHKSQLGDEILGAFAYRARYTQSGNQVLIYTYGDLSPPDTATLVGDRLTVRAQFYRGSLANRYVLAMVYGRQ